MNIGKSTKDKIYPSIFVEIHSSNNCLINVYFKNKYDVWYLIYFLIRTPINVMIKDSVWLSVFNSIQYSNIKLKIK